ncbi:MAG: archaetidylserine decarboxylase [Pseudomonadota bacterium]
MLLATVWQHVWPRHALAHITRALCESERPWLKRALIRYFLYHHPVDLHEALIGDIDAYPSFNAFFSRVLKPGARPICNSVNSIAAPVDGRVSEFGTLTDTTLLQAKGQPYTLEALLATAWPRNQHLRNGIYATFYLSPEDCHRVYAPLASRLLHSTHVPGRLFSVQPRVTQRVPVLYARNERMICEFDSPFGRYVLVLVGAGFVSGIVTRWSGLLKRGNSRISSQAYDDSALHYAKGEEVAHFLMGSTVLVLLPPRAAHWLGTLATGHSVRFGEAIGQASGECAPIPVPAATASNTTII